ncbi:hypothetical protein KFE25_003260 [Diacronema lutheri]|uniref:3-beta hydroxysteroid dehydrogenase/isomerase domain-containing protein n=1 Tax=Diacronema lutheri TaxID=2081491 RepID=A0A8J6C768_DIALT|nr:hypothetical protein KFE25_003260 [Diacronema lutheri]
MPARCVVTGGLGFVEQRVVETLGECGAQRVALFDIAPRPADARSHPAIKFVQGDLRGAAAVELIQLAHAAGTLGTCLGRPLKLKPFAVEVLTMHARQPRWPGHARAAPRAAPLGIGPSAAR